MLRRLQQQTWCGVIFAAVSAIVRSAWSGFWRWGKVSSCGWVCDAVQPRPCSVMVGAVLVLAVPCQGSAGCIWHSCCWYWVVSLCVAGWCTTAQGHVCQLCASLCACVFAILYCVMSPCPWLVLLVMLVPLCIWHVWLENGYSLHHSVYNQKIYARFSRIPTMHASTRFLCCHFCHHCSVCIVVSCSLLQVVAVVAHYVAAPQHGCAC